MSKALRTFSSMRNKLIALAVLLTVSTTLLTAQLGTYYGVKGGLGINNQQWTGRVNNQLLFTPNIDFMAETYDPGSWSSLYSQIGYHQRGSGLGGFGFQRFATYRFHNISVEVGGKRKATDGEKWDSYYMLGLRAEYTVSNNLQEEGQASLFNLALSEFVRKFNYGVTIGGGFDYDLGNDRIVFFEVAFSPDLSSQYDQPFQLTFPNPNTASPLEDISIAPQMVRNYSLELRVGYKWLH